jgi:hypothetical protein
MCYIHIGNYVEEVLTGLEAYKKLTGKKIRCNGNEEESMILPGPLNSYMQKNIKKI